MMTWKRCGMKWPFLIFRKYSSFILERLRKAIRNLCQGSWYSSSVRIVGTQPFNPGTSQLRISIKHATRVFSKMCKEKCPQMCLLPNTGLVLFNSIFISLKDNVTDVNGSLARHLWYFNGCTNHSVKGYMKMR